MKRLLVKKIYWVLTILLSLITCSPGQAALTDNLIGYWGFDSSGADGSGNGRDVTLYGFAGYGTGLFGQALSLPGSPDSYAARPVNDTVYNFGSSNFTVQIWANFNTLSNEQTLIEKFVGGSGPGWTVTKLSPFAVQSNQIQVYPGLVYSNPVVTINEWHQVVARRNGAILSIFLDGAEATRDIGFAYLDTTNPLLIGRREGSQLFPVNGLLDEAAIWSRALSDSEIAYLWNNGAGNSVGFAPLPSTIMLLGSGLLGLVGLRRFKV